MDPRRPHDDVKVKVAQAPAPVIDLNVLVIGLLLVAAAWVVVGM